MPISSAVSKRSKNLQRGSNLIKPSIKNITLCFSLFVSALTGAGLAKAEDSYNSYGRGGNTYIEEFSVCKEVQNNTLTSHFVPTKTAAEWNTGGQSFLENTPAGLSVSDPCVPGTFTEARVFTDPLSDFYAADIQGNYLYTLSGYTMSVFDITTPDAPVLISSISNSAIGDLIKVRGNYAYIIEDGANGFYTFSIIDVSNPASPVFTGETEYNGGVANANSFDIQGNYVYIATVLDDIEVFDVSTPSAPVLIESFSNSNMPSPQAIVVDGNYAYVTDYADKIVVLNISNPSSLSYVSQVTNSTVLDRAVAMEKSGDTLFILSSSTGGLSAYDVSSPTSPTLLDSVSDASLNGIGELKISGSYAFTTHGINDTFSVIDISDPSNLSITGSMSNSYTTQAYNLTAAGNYVYIAANDQAQLYIFDVSDPANPVFDTALSSAGFRNPSALIAQDNYAYVAASDDNTLNVLDISTPLTPSIMGSVSSASLAGIKNISKHQNLIAATSRDNDSFSLINVSNPASPVITDTISTPSIDGATAVSMFGNYAYVLSNISDSLTIFDISNPSNITQTGTISGPSLDNGTGLSIAGDYAYVIRNNNLIVLDISDPAAPAIVSTLSNTALEGVKNIDIQGDYAYITSAYISVSTFFYASRLVIVDISDKTSPSIVSSRSSASYNYGGPVVAKGNYAYTGGDEFKVWDITDKSNPVVLQTISYTDYLLTAGTDYSNGIIYFLHPAKNTMHVMDISCTFGC
jgi:hypothetical protein